MKFMDIIFFIAEIIDQGVLIHSAEPPSPLHTLSYAGQDPPPLGGVLIYLNGP